MVGFVIATHGSLSKGLLDAVELIAGKQDNIKTVSLDHGDSVEGYTQNFENAIKSANTGKGVLVFLDFFGGTPSNVAASYLKEEGISFVLGVNLPMILEVLYLRDSIELKEMEEKCVNTGRQSIAKLSDKFRDLKLEFKNDF